MFGAYVPIIELNLGIPVVFYDGLVEALYAFLSTDDAIIAAYPGGWTDCDADRDTPFIYGIYDETDSTRLNTYRAGYAIEKSVVTLTTVAPSAEKAKAAARVLKSRLLANGNYIPLQFNIINGREVTRFSTGNDSTVLNQERGPLNVDVWETKTPITWKLARGGE